MTGSVTLVSQKHGLAIFDVVVGESGTDPDQVIPAAESDVIAIVQEVFSNAPANIILSSDFNVGDTVSVRVLAAGGTILTVVDQATNITMGATIGDSIFRKLPSGPWFITRN